MQMFMPWCRARIFRNERSRSTPLDPKLMFRCVFSVWVHLEPFLYCTKLAAKHAKLAQLMQKFVPWCLVRIFATNTPDPHHWTLNSCFGVFLSVRVHFGPFRYCTKLGAKCTKLVQLMQKFVQRCLVIFFETNAPDTHHWTLNSCFGSFLSVLVHLEPFRYCTKLAAKCAKLVQLIQKFRPWFLVKSFATDAPDLHYWTLNSCFGAFLSFRVLFGPFRYCTKLGAKAPN